MNNHVVSSRFIVRRNFEDMAFPGRMDNIQKQIVLARVGDAVSETDPPFEMVAGGRPLDERELQLLRSHGLETSILQDGSAVFVAPEDMHIAVNFEDAVTLESTFDYDDPDQALAKIQIETSRIFRSYPAAYRERIGFLTAKPHFAGNGILVSTVVHLPVLTELKQISATATDVRLHSSCTLTPMEIAGEKNLAALYEISDTGRGTTSAKEGLSAVQRAVEMVVKRERALAEKVFAVPHSALVDQAFRAYGIMRYARRMNINEFLTHWSRLRMGSENGILDVKLPLIDGLFKEVAYVPKPQDPKEAKSLKETNFWRAEIIRKRLMEDNYATLR